MAWQGLLGARVNRDSANLAGAGDRDKGTPGGCAGSSGPVSEAHRRHRREGFIVLDQLRTVGRKRRIDSSFLHLPAPHFRRNAPFFLHVGDVISELDLGGLYAAQERSGNLATLAVNDRGSSRCILFDDQGLMGRDNQIEGWERSVRPPDGSVRRWSFAGVHAVSPDIFDRFVEALPFDILDAYLRMVSEGSRIAPFDVTGSRWLEVGNPERLAETREVLAEDG